MDKIKTNRDIFEYVDKFHNAQKETVLMEIMKDTELQRYLSTVEGRLVCNSVVDKISSDIGSLIDVVRNGEPDMAKSLLNIAQRINVALDFMVGLAAIAKKGMEHETRMQ